MGNGALFSLTPLQMSPPNQSYTPLHGGHPCLVLMFGNGQTNFSFESVNSKHSNDIYLVLNWFVLMLWDLKGFTCVTCQLD